MGLRFICERILDPLNSMCEPKYESYEINECIRELISVKLVRLKT